MIVYEGDIAQVTCRQMRIKLFKWMIGRLEVSFANLKDLNICSNNSMSTISFRADSRLNESKINCIARNENGQLLVSTATVFIQGDKILVTKYV